MRVHLQSKSGIRKRKNYRSQALGGRDQEREGQRLSSDEAKYRSWRSLSIKNQRERSSLEVGTTATSENVDKRPEEISGLLKRQTELKEFHFFKSKSMLEGRRSRKQSC